MPRKEIIAITLTGSALPAGIPGFRVYFPDLQTKRWKYSGLDGGLPDRLMKEYFKATGKQYPFERVSEFVAFLDKNYLVIKDESIVGNKEMSVRDVARILVLQESQK